jgi:ribosome maturation factor RimP
MITKEQVHKLIKDKLEERNCFVVDLDVRSGNNILLEIDSIKGITVKDCVDFSKAVEANLDREIDDFELQVSSPGLGKPFRVKEQYIKNIGRNVKVTPIDGTVVKGELKEVSENEIMVEHSYKEKIEGRKKKQTIIKQEKINFNNIKETTIIISFK